MTRHTAAAVAVALLGLVFANICLHYTERQSLRPLAASYVARVPQQRATPNVVTGILMTFRAFDTLGEVAVLFMVAAGVSLLLGGGRPVSVNPPQQARRTPSSEIVRTGTKVLLPLISIFAAYIIMNGHLSAGGGFQGGAVIASGVMLLLLAWPDAQLDRKFLSTTESLAGVMFVLVGIAGMIFAGGFLDNRVLPLRAFGAFFSAGAIPILSVLLGVKVGCELSVIIDGFRQ